MSNKPTNIHGMLAETHQIAVVWEIEDVLEVRPDLSNAQCWEVLRHVKKHHDATVGINWDVLAYQAEILFGDAPESVDTPELIEA